MKDWIGVRFWCYVYRYVCVNGRDGNGISVCIGMRIGMWGLVGVGVGLFLCWIWGCNGIELGF